MFFCLLHFRCRHVTFLASELLLAERNVVLRVESSKSSCNLPLPFPWWLPSAQTGKILEEPQATVDTDKCDRCASV